MPPEVIHIILENLSQTDVKQARLVSKKWAAIGARSLNVLTVYLSPRDKDMEVFDVITQHPIFRATAKHLVFDSAQFIKLSEEHYITAFIRDLEAQAEYDECPYAQRFIHLLNKPFTESACDTAIFDRDHAHDHFRSVEELMDGFRQYSEYVEQQKNLLYKPWFHRACRGLEALPYLRTVTVCNAWSTIHVEDYAGGDSQMEGAEVPWDDLFVDNACDEERRPYDYLSISGPALLSRIDEYSGQSPVARLWPNNCLRPIGPLYPLLNPKLAMRRMGISDGSFEVYKLGQLLNAARKQPSEIMLPGGWGSHHGLSPIVFNVRNWPVFTHLSSVSGRLEVLHVKLSPHINVTGDWETDKYYLSGLKSMISNAKALQELTLSKVLGPAETDTEHGVFNLGQIFPPVAEWLCTTLRKLELHGFPTSYKQLAGLLFLNIPNLEVLRLGNMTLFDGHWADIVEGLRHLDALQSCIITDGLFYLGDDYLYNDDYGIDEAVLQLCRYINHGGRHPSLFSYEPDTASAKYMVRLNETLDELRLVRPKFGANATNL
ncbi:MAG: hypothetical protein Q9226_007994 [Calogaya cf. arnoldii]